MSEILTRNANHGLSRFPGNVRPDFSLSRMPLLTLSNVDIFPRASFWEFSKRRLAHLSVTRRKLFATARFYRDFTIFVDSPIDLRRLDCRTWRMDAVDWAVKRLFCVSLRCLITYLIFIFYIMSNGDYIIIIRFYIGIDKYSFYMIILSIWIIGLIYLSLFFDERSEMTLKIVIFNIIIIVLMLFFGSFNLLLIYLFFEIRLIPTFIIVFYWGNNLERLRASCVGRCVECLIFIIFTRSCK